MLSHLATEVYSIERLRGLHDKARENLRPLRLATFSYAWRENPSPKGQPAGDKALQWWLQQLSHSNTRNALLRKAPQSPRLGVESDL